MSTLERFVGAKVAGRTDPAGTVLRCQDGGALAVSLSFGTSPRLAVALGWDPADVEAHCRGVVERDEWDCAFAALATAAAVPYEEAAEALGFPVRSSHGLPDATVNERQGIHDQELVAAAYRLGFGGVLLTPREAVGGQHSGPLCLLPLEEIRAALRGRPAIIKTAARGEPGVGHYLAWRNGRLFDPASRGLKPRLDDVAIWGVLLLVPLGLADVASPGSAPA